jgi:hypothetical protein
VNNRTFLSSSTSSPLKISHSRLSTTASLVRRLMRRSSLILSNPEVRFHSEAVEVLSRSGGKILGDEGPGTGVGVGTGFGTGFRKGEVTRDEAADAGRSEPLMSLPFPASETVATDDCFLFFLMKSPGVIV